MKQQTNKTNMKTQQEIVIQAKAYAESIGNEDGTSAYDYVMGYTQSQEDMADKKYTEQDMIDAIIYGSSLTTSNVKLYAHNYINSLNKQDNE